MSDWAQFEAALLALVAWREAASEGPVGLRAVMHTVRNRVLAGWGDWCSVITGKNQFTSMSMPGDPQLVKWPSPRKHPGFKDVLAAARAVYEGADIDPTGGALYYRNPDAATSAWFEANVAQSLKFTKLRIGRHDFYAPKTD